MFNRVRTKILFFYSALIIVLGLFFLAFFINLVKDIHLKILQREMTEKIRFIDILFREHRAGYFSSKKELQSITTRLSSIINLRITFIDFRGKVLADSSVDAETMDNHLYRREVQESLRRGTGHSIRYSNTTRRDMMYMAWKSSDHIIRLSKDVKEIDESVAQVRRAVMLFGLLGLVCAFIINYAISRIITRPINKTIEFADGFARGDLERRIFNYSDDEIGRLQKSLNKLADTLHDKISTLILERYKLEATIESIGDGIAVIDTDKKIILSNRALSALLDIRTAPSGKYYYEVIRNSVLNSRIEKALSRGTADAAEIELLDGRFCDMHLNPVREEKGIQGILVVLHDITERKKMVRLKTELVGNLSHELKTPITILKGYLETIRSRIHDRDSIEGFIDKALINVDRQNSIINDMLKLNMLETSEFFMPENINLKEIIGNCLSILAPKISEKRIAVRVETGAIPETIRANRFLAEEIFFNLIDNAINYNRFDGSIAIKAVAGAAMLSILISDSGIGIPADSVGRVFERFYRVNKSRSRTTGGTGLGLSIVKHSVEILQWQIEVHSDDSGSTFTVEVPLTPV